uniref:Uncharacterized protein n=1 Tax=Myoviridae sp. ctZgq1 TaxID=2826666 RepID=A0A8S5LX84_9CAUD|nr:MAG TPA: hypothetical protein [Myoviridae sp. ctZgq1]
MSRKIASLVARFFWLKINRVGKKCNHNSGRRKKCYIGLYILIGVN